MTRADARTILEEQLRPYRALPFDQLLPLLEEKQLFEGDGYSGAIYAIWDDRDQRQLRLWAEISYSFWTSFVPVVVDDLIDDPAWPTRSAS